MVEHNLAIDIQLKKLLSWLLSRRICPKEWHQGVVSIRAKIGEAMGDMPEHPAVKALLSGTNINYFHCLEIVDILKETEKESKTFFGSYGSQRMKDWQEVVSLYQRDSVYLAEAAQLLSQAVTYEIPAMKKQLAKAVQVQEECDKKEKDNLKKAKEFQQDFDKSCHQLGIQGQRLRQEIISQLSGLPDVYRDLAQDCQKIALARNLYVNFLKASPNPPEEPLDTLNFLIEHGNVTTYQWIHREAPVSVEEPTLDFGDDGDEESQPDQLDLGEDIDFGSTDLVDPGAAAQGDIDWGNLDGDDAEVEIDWGDMSDAIATVDESIVGGITVEEGGISGGVARDSEALSLLDNRRTRTLILDDLAELACFLQHRIFELHAREEGKFVLGGGSSMDQPEDSNTMVSMVSEIESIVAKLTAGKLHHLQLIRSSPKYVDRLVDGLRSKQRLVSKMETLNRGLAIKRDDAIQEQAMAQKKVGMLKEKTSTLQEQIEADISPRYQNRPVNIMGGIQSV